MCKFGGEQQMRFVMRKVSSFCYLPTVLEFPSSIRYLITVTKSQEQSCH